MARFDDRTHAGRELAPLVAASHPDPEMVVVGVARGGVVVAAEVARVLDLTLEVIVVRKIGLPGREEVAMGAVGEGGVVVSDDVMRRSAGVSEERFTRALHDQEVELARRVARYRGGAPLGLARRVALIVDDGVATGATATAALRSARVAGASRVLLGVPVAARSAVRELRADADDVVALELAVGAFAVGEWYGDFDQTSDEQVVACLAAARAREGHETAT